MAMASLRHTSSAVKLARNVSGSSPKPLLPLCSDPSDRAQNSHAVWRWLLICLLALFALFAVRRELLDSIDVLEGDLMLPNIQGVPASHGEDGPTMTTGDSVLKFDPKLAELDGFGESDHPAILTGDSVPELVPKLVPELDELDKLNELDPGVPASSQPPLVVAAAPQRDITESTFVEPPTEVAAVLPVVLEQPRMIPVLSAKDAEAKARHEVPPIPYSVRSGTDAPVRVAKSDDCKDLREQCYSWGRLGECERNSNYMHRECRRSCGLCVPEDEDYLYEDLEGDTADKAAARLKAVQAKRRKADPDPRLPCVDSTRECEHWERTGECDMNPSFMLRECRISCAVCDPNVAGLNATS